MNKTILIASHNQNKVVEFKNILPEFTFITLSDLNDNEDFNETGDSFETNSYDKAWYYYQKYQIPTLADDSGLEIAALNNEPGIYSKRYSGFGDHENNLLVLEKLNNITNRDARFRCVLTFVYKKDSIIQFEGTIEGEISQKIQGDEGFGYDPIFMIKNENKTLAELGKTYKNKHSHRAKVLQAFKDYIEKHENTYYKWYSRRYQ